jgi:hypothetical protein
MKRVGRGENYILESFFICTLKLMLIMVIEAGRMRWAGHVDSYERSEMYSLLI